MTGQRTGHWETAFARVPELLAAHIELSFAALALALAICVPLAILALRYPRFAAIALGFASLVQTIPALALLALFYPLLLGVAALTGGGVSALGFLPALLALTLYALLPILRNAVTGLTGIDPAAREAADGIGMTAAQKLRLVEAPLAAPTIMAGIRTAAVWTIGAATLSTTVGKASLGDLIFAGLQTQNWALVLTGCAASAGLAIVVDTLLGLATRGIATRRRWMSATALALLGAILIGAILPVALASDAEDRDSIVIGAKGFSEQYILARLIGGRLERADYSVSYRDGLGSAVAFGALASGDIDIAVDYSGTIWTNEMQRETRVPRDEMLRGIEAWARETHGVDLLGPLGFENTYAFAVRRDDAQGRRLATLDDLARASPDLAFGTDLEFLERPEWRAVRDAYGLRFAAERAFSPTFMYNALVSGEVDAISAFSSDGRIAANELVVLADPKGAIPNYEAMLLLSRDVAKDRRLRAALRPLIGAIDVEMMRAANYRVDRDTDKTTPAAAARWLNNALQGKK